MSENRWVTVNKEGSPLKGRKLLLDDNGNVIGGNMPSHVKDKVAGNNNAPKSRDEKLDHVRKNTKITDDTVYKGKKTMKRHKLAGKDSELWYGNGHGNNDEQRAGIIAAEKMADKITAELQKKYPKASAKLEYKHKSTGIGHTGFFAIDPKVVLRGVPHDDPAHESAPKLVAAEMTKHYDDPLLDIAIGIRKSRRD